MLLFLQDLNIWTMKHAQENNLEHCALSIAEKHDRIHLKPTRHEYANWLENNGETLKNSNEDWTKQNLANRLPSIHLSELNWGFGEHNFDQISSKNLTNNASELKKAIEESENPKLLSWWAKFTELHNNHSLALTYYKKAGDLVNSTRLLCALGKTNEAKTEVESFETKLNSTNDEKEKIAFKNTYRGACYNIATHEEEDDPVEAVKYYQLADAPHSAIRVAKNHDLHDVLMDIAMKSFNVNDVLETAAHYEHFGYVEKAAQLYIRGRDYRKGFTLALQSRNDLEEDTLVDLLDSMIDALAMSESSVSTEITIPRDLLNQAASFLMKNEKTDRAVELLARLGDFDAALDVLDQYDVDLNQQLVTVLDHSLSLRPSKSGERLQKRLADHAMQNGHYRLAAQKFSESGSYKQAIKALCRSGDVHAIIQFTSRARQPEVYIAAANFLQTTDWASDDKILTSIQNFYTKAKAFDKLSKFLKTFALIQLTETKDLDRCIWALNNTVKADKKTGSSDTELETSIETLELLKAFKLSDNVDALLESIKTTDLIQHEHVYSYLVEFYSNIHKNISRVLRA